MNVITNIKVASDIVTANPEQHTILWAEQFQDPPIRSWSIPDGPVFIFDCHADIAYLTYQFREKNKIVGEATISFDMHTDELFLDTTTWFADKRKASAGAFHKKVEDAFTPEFLAFCFAQTAALFSLLRKGSYTVEKTVIKAPHGKTKDRYTYTLINKEVKEDVESA